MPTLLRIPSTLSRSLQIPTFFLIAIVGCSMVVAVVEPGMLLRIHIYLQMPGSKPSIKLAEVIPPMNGSPPVEIPSTSTAMDVALYVEYEVAKRSLLCSKMRCPQRILSITKRVEPVEGIIVYKAYLELAVPIDPSLLLIDGKNDGTKTSLNKWGHMRFLSLAKSEGYLGLRSFQYTSEEELTKEVKEAMPSCARDLLVDNAVEEWQVICYESPYERRDVFTPLGTKSPIVSDQSSSLVFTLYVRKKPLAQPKTKDDETIIAKPLAAAPPKPPFRPLNIKKPQNEDSMLDGKLLMRIHLYLRPYYRLEEVIPPNGDEAGAYKPPKEFSADTNPMDVADHVEHVVAKRCSDYTKQGRPLEVRTITRRFDPEEGVVVYKAYLDPPYQDPETILLENDPDAMSQIPKKQNENSNSSKRISARNKNKSKYKKLVYVRFLNASTGSFKLAQKRKPQPGDYLGLRYFYYNRREELRAEVMEMVPIFAHNLTADGGDQHWKMVGDVGEKLWAPLGLGHDSYDPLVLSYTIKMQLQRTITKRTANLLNPATTTSSGRGSSKRRRRSEED